MRDRLTSLNHRINHGRCKWIRKAATFDWKIFEKNLTYSD